MTEPARRDAERTDIAPHRLAALLEGVRTEAWLALAAGGLLVMLAWPEGATSVVYPDSREYLRWPEAAAPRMGVGPRMFGYPLMLQALGSGSGIVVFQVVAWAVGFGGLGYALARVPGLLSLGLLALCPAIAWWNVAVLSESLSLSLLALLFALSLRIARGPAGLGWFVAWGLACVAFGFLRPGNLFVLPFLALPFVRQNLAQRTAACGLVAVLLLIGITQAQLAHAWRINYYTAYLTRILPDPAARPYFEVRGMPKASLDWDHDAFLSWFDQHGQAAYTTWFLLRPASYVEAWQWLVKPEEGEHLREKYFARQERLASSWTPVAAWLFRWTAWPQWLWAGLLCVAPVVARWRTGRVGLLAVWPVVLGLGTYLQAFLSYHGSGSAEIRHLLVASLMYRFSWMIALVSIVESVWRGSGEERPLAAAARAGPRGDRPPDRQSGGSNRS